VEPARAAQGDHRGASRPVALSRHSYGNTLHFDIQANNLNAWSRVPGNPFADGLILQPNHPGGEPLSVTFGPFDLPQRIDTFTCLLACAGGSGHGHVVRATLEVLDSSQTVLGAATARLRTGDEVAATARYNGQNMRGGSLRFRTIFERFIEGAPSPRVLFPYLLGYERNSLVEAFNAAGSDKGTERHSPLGGVPHGYALDYHGLFTPLREDKFALLEIGLQDTMGTIDRLGDAPSLRVWREFFPRATLYGYDIEDFGFFKQERTVTFQGDQGSRTDLGRFLRAHHMPRFRLVIDDGSHASSHQQISLAILFDQVEPGGLYVIEDLHWQPFEESPTTLEVLQGFLKRRQIASPFLSDAETRRLEATILSVEIRKPNDAEFAVIQKKPDEE
jgi:hypothetical protein